MDCLKIGYILLFSGVSDEVTFQLSSCRQLTLIEIRTYLVQRHVLSTLATRHIGYPEHVVYHWKRLQSMAYVDSIRFNYNLHAIFSVTSSSLQVQLLSLHWPSNTRVLFRSHQFSEHIL